MRICLYTNTALPVIGGQEYVVDALARHLTVLGQEVVVLAPRSKHHWFLHDRSRPYPVLRHPRFLSMRRMVECYRWWLLRACRRHAFDLVHCHGIYPPGYLAGLSRQELGIPYLITSHGGDVYPENPRLSDQRLAPRHVAAVAQADALIAISQFTHENLERLCPNGPPIVDIPNGVDVAALSTPAPRPADLDVAIQPGKYVLFLGRLVDRKGVDVALQALARLPARREVQLVIAGDGSARGTLEELAATLNLTERVRFVGRRQGSDKHYLLQNARCLVVPSRQWEAFPLVILEGYAAGLPVIATELSGMGGFVRSGQTGWLLPPESVEALAQTLEQVLSSSEPRDTYGRQACQFVQAYDWARVAQAHLDLYGQILRARAKKAA